MKDFLRQKLWIRFKRWDRRLLISKRQQFVIITTVLTLGLTLTQLVGIEYRYTMVGALTISTYVLTAFALRDDLKGIEWVTLLSLPTLFTMAVSLFYFLLPVRWLTRVPVALLYAIGIYALLLTENIFNVAVNRTIALLRAGHSVGFLMTLVTYFLLLQTIFAFRFTAFGNVFFVFCVSLPLVLQTLWFIELEPMLTKKVTHLSLIIVLVLTQLVWIFSFWPVKSTLFALLLTTTFYSLGGMAQQYLVEKLYKKSVIEFFSVMSLVFLIILFATHWRGNG
ncbi:hypothetical protein HY409_00710 [Candidatus Gottesmanbacteria bacterium]|nr:hypothetical protein [Candidatus Gottesmanbacteria bacterium]